MKQTMNFTIEKNIALPERHKTKYSFLADLKVGDSFIVPNKKIAQRVTQAIHHYSLEYEENKNGSALRQQTDGTYRIWKTVKRPYKATKNIFVRAKETLNEAKKLDRIVNI